MADAMARIMQNEAVVPSNAWGRQDRRMLELLFIAQMARNPVQAMARRWYCRGLFRATRGKLRCAECTKA